ncbi:hypothetical protein RND71_036061 [Anisodus tanguticus]|uniref:Presenilin n=1 Tax=Anisodus tanguticus TaxID=243964 RepID=A0AAE1R676_9SOLA|nr:hypothetical protein RND71_036061 [Anisodus tanguticus]
MEGGSILETMGVEIMGVMSAVSICMFLVVLIVYSLTSPSDNNQQVLRTAANLVYLESSTDTTSQKLEGVISVFSQGVPILLNQMYMVALGIIVAAWFTKLPEWTTWVVLVALALYDLVAVLAPGGPLKMLVELASSRDEELPALVYEARPNVGSRMGNRGPNLGLLLAGFTNGDPIELRVMSSRENVVHNEMVSENVIMNEMRSENVVMNEMRSENEEIDGVREVETLPLIGSTNERDRSRPTGEIRESNGSDRSWGQVLEREIEEEEEERGRGIKLGLGDFVFYSVLVGRAAMYDLMTVYACYLAIISGLGCTLILLAVCRHALPALPISIALGVIFYFLTRLLMEPFVVGTSTNLLMF